MSKAKNVVNVFYRREVFSKNVHRVSYIAFGKNPEAYEFTVLENESFEVPPHSGRKEVWQILYDKTKEIAPDADKVNIHPEDRNDYGNM